MSSIIKLLERIRTRPLAIYVGKQSLSRLAFFLRGYDCALADAGSADSFLADFRDWIHQKYACTTASWEDLIVKDAGNDADAVSRFWELLDEYSQQDAGRLAAVAELPQRSP